jgi:hypothetical protein
MFVIFISSKNIRSCHIIAVAYRRYFPKYLIRIVTSFDSLKILKKINNVCICITPLLFTCSSFFLLSPFRPSVRGLCLSCHPSPHPLFLVLYVDALCDNTAQNLLVQTLSCYVPEGAAPSRKVSIHIWYGELHLCWLYKRVKVEIQDPARWNSTGRSMTALQPVLSPIRCHHRLTALSFPPARIPYAFQNTLLFHYFYLFKIA